VLDAEHSEIDAFTLEARSWPDTSQQTRPGAGQSTAPWRPPSSGRTL